MSDILINATEPTGRQGDVLDFIEAYTGEKGFAPTVREIGVAVGIRSTATVHEHLVALRRKGLITQENRRSRTLRVVKP